MRIEKATIWRCILAMMMSMAFAAAQANEETGNAAAASTSAKARVAHHAKKPKRAHNISVNTKEVAAPAGQPDKLTLTLTLTLTPPKGPPQPHAIPAPQPLPPAISAEMQKEVEVRNKELQDLNAQIAELERVIQERKAQLETRSASSVVAVPVAAPVSVAAPAQQVPGAVQVSAAASEAASAPVSVAPPPAPVAPAAVKPAARTGGVVDQFGHYLPALAIGLLAVLLAGYAYFRFRSRRIVVDQSQPEQASIAVPANAMKTQIIKPQAVETRSTIKVPVQTAETVQKTILPPEYELLEEADIYLRFGHDKLAEEALLEAIKINPRNPQAYLTLLRIYFSREDAATFLGVAKQLKPVGDESVWARVVEMGHSLDPNNAFYS